MNRLFLWILVIAATGLVSCDSKRVYDEYHSISKTWNKDSVVAFKLEDITPNKEYNLFINVRNNNEFDFSNLFLIAEIQFPQGKVITDTLEYEMAAPDGQWLGTGFGSVKESKLWYKEQVSFEETGQYVVFIKHAMRKNNNEQGIENLEGITEIGFRIEEAPK